MAHDCENALARYFAGKPAELALCQALIRWMLQQFPKTTLRVQKSQVSLDHGHPFAAAWLPVRTVKGRPDHYIVVSFWLGHRLESSREVGAAEPYPGRWTHHVLLQDEAELDPELADWLGEAYALAARRKNRQSGTA